MHHLQMQKLWRAVMRRVIKAYKAGGKGVLLNPEEVAMMYLSFDGDFDEPASPDSQAGER